MSVSNHSCHSCHTKTVYHKASVAEKMNAALVSVALSVSKITLVFFALVASKKLFVPFYAAGVALGIYQFMYADQNSHGGPRSMCSSGFLQEITGVELPEVVSIGFNAAITWCHIDHHADIFVPMIAVYAGAETGKTTLNLCSRFIEKFA